MSAGNSYFPFGLKAPGQRTNHLVVASLAALLSLVLVGLWLYLYLKSLEKPYTELKGYRIAVERTFAGFLRRGDNRARFQRLSDFLQEHGVADAAGAHKLLRQGSDWLDLDEPAFAIPPLERWRNMLATLVVLRDEVEPTIGPVEVVSAYRSRSYSRKSGGADSNRHRDFCGLDLVPQSNISRKELVLELRNLHARLGPASKLGLGIYSDVRFHIDTCGYRSW